MNETRRPTILLAVIPIIVLVTLLALNVYVYGEDATYGSNQIALLIAAAVATMIGFSLKFSWKEMQSGIVKSISAALPALIILLLIGSLAGTWMISGVVPTMIYYGLQILNPTIFLFAACAVSAIVAIATGSSWSTIATVGLALLGIGTVLGINPGVIAGAIISGAYFGDKMSPLSDTTNLAPAMAGTDLFTHIRYMALTTIPSIIITLIIFLIWGFTIESNPSEEGVQGILSLLESKFYISPLLFLVPVAVIILIIKKIDAIPALFIGTLLGAAAAVIFQPDLMTQISGETGNYLYVAYKGTMDAMFGGISILSDDFGQFEPLLNQFGQAKDIPTAQITALKMESKEYQQLIIKDAETYKAIHKLFATGGMFGMMNTVWLIICAMAFGGIMEACGLLQRITSAVVSLAKTTGSLISTTVGTCVFFNATASDQYLSIVVPGRMFAKTYKDRGLAPQNLSRTLEDSGTVTSVLFPWNTCGAAQSTVLGVATGEYWMYCFFNLISPVMTMIYGYFGIKIAKLSADGKK
ncbi:MAG: sodium:proton antiporter [Crocinitomicaceae bacterium]|nr:sodium:proton antiporter [Crocinitomicaceae bacterium]MBT6515188.1 sodium:proton antiporter [Crocinitomicaceae bacterium]